MELDEDGPIGSKGWARGRGGHGDGEDVRVVGWRECACHPQVVGVNICASRCAHHRAHPSKRANQSMTRQQQLPTLLPPFCTPPIPCRRGGPGWEVRLLLTTLPSMSLYFHPVHRGIQQRLFPFAPYLVFAFLPLYACSAFYHIILLSF